MIDIREQISRVLNGGFSPDNPYLSGMHEVETDGKRIKIKYNKDLIESAELRERHETNKQINYNKFR